jgi:hypothetical protein
MQELDDHLEVIVTRDDVDDAWQLRDLGATLRPYREHSLAVAAQTAEALAGSPESLRP